MREQKIQFPGDHKNLFYFALRLKRGDVGVMPTDTVYGIVASAMIPESVERVYKIRERNIHKPCIILIPDVNSLSKFSVPLSTPCMRKLEKLWPGAVSVILECSEEKYSYLHREMKTLAFRVPAEKWLRKFLAISGPIVAPSANLEGENPATTLEEAKGYFKDLVDFYIDGGKSNTVPSTLVQCVNGTVKVIRKGAVQVEEN